MAPARIPYRCLLTADCLRGDIKAIELGYQERSARTGSGIDLGDHIVVVGALLLIDVDPAWRCVRRPIPTPTCRVNALEVGVVIHTIHRFRRRHALNFLARQAVVHGHLWRNSGADK